jgi:hypothetical protein
VRFHLSLEVITKVLGVSEESVSSYVVCAFASQRQIRPGLRPRIESSEQEEGPGQHNDVRHSERRKEVRNQLIRECRIKKCSNHAGTKKYSKRLRVNEEHWMNPKNR